MHVLMPPIVCEMTWALKYHHPGDLYTPDHRVVGERALNESALPRKGISGLRALLALHISVLVPILQAHTARWQAAPKEWILRVVCAYSMEAAIGGQAPKTKMVEIVFYRAYDVKVSTPMKHQNGGGTPVLARHPHLKGYLVYHPVQRPAKLGAPCIAGVVPRGKHRRAAAPKCFKSPPSISVGITQYFLRPESSRPGQACGCRCPSRSFPPSGRWVGGLGTGYGAVSGMHGCVTYVPACLGPLIQFLDLGVEAARDLRQPDFLPLITAALSSLDFGVWESLLHDSTSPKLLMQRIREEVLRRWLGVVGHIPIPADI